MRHARQDYNRIQDPTGKIPASEPVFLLRGQDVCAPIAVQAWADEAEKRGSDAELIRVARAWAAEMLTYQANQKSKVPDQPKYQVPDIVPGFGFRTRTSEGLFYIQACDDAGTCLVYAYDKTGVFLWRDRWVVDEMKKRFESGEYWAVRVGEMTEGRRVVLYDPGAMQTPWEALMGEPPKSWCPDSTVMEPPHAAALKIAAENDPNADIKNINTNTDEGQLLIAAIATITGQYATNKTPFQIIAHLRTLQIGIYRERNLAPDGNYQQAATGEGVQCVKCGQWYPKEGVCEKCFADE